ncbi:bifunctional DNA primase/polymerase [Brevibacterium epidermidis]|uniref:bifunctional DNA primase/polymerase n=1 Tax=Brevibacterium epidermidis TaxID=1698 RepID=UPI001F530295|nr:bifunctional DNA primase/polymerase [Brevibacterium epidermidis]
MAVRSRFTTALRRMDPTTFLPEAADLLARHGVPIFPCAPEGKQPITRHGFHDATTDSAQVKAWWRRFPAANIGMPTGRASGVSVVDVDVHGANGYEAIRRARQAGLVSGWEAMGRSPTGGLHIYYPAADGEQPSWQAGTAGVDFRGDRGYIIVPPSRRRIDGETVLYRPTSFAPTEGRALDAQRLREFLTPPRPRRPVAPNRDAEAPDASRLASWLGTQSTDRNLKLFWAACRLAEGNVPETEALDAFAAVEQPDFEEREITRTVQSAYRTIATAPATLTRTQPAPRRTGQVAELARPPAPSGRGLA